jgi:hypothetical protein
MQVVEAEMRTSWMSRRTAKWLTPVLLVFGVELWLTLGEGDYGHQIYKPLVILAIAAAGLIGPIHRGFERVWVSLERPGSRTRGWIALGIAIAASVFLLWTERFQQIAFAPKFHDEFSYLIQVRMLAKGRFWMPALPLPEFFKTFYLIVKPAYASMYFPGAAMMWAPALALHLPYWTGTLAVAGLCAGMLYLMLAEILDGAYAMLGVLLLLSMSRFRLMSITLLAQLPMLLCGLVMTWAVLQWRKKQAPGWLVLLGAAAGWAGITRPLDGICFVIVLGSVMAVDLRRAPWRKWLEVVCCVVAPTLPFLVLQLVLNHGITGNWLTTPFGKYNDVNYPGALGFHGGAAPAHISDVPEMEAFYEQSVKWLLEEHRLKNLGTGLKKEWELTSRIAIADQFLWVIAPLSLLVMWDRRFWLVWGMLPVFLLVMSTYAFSWILPHYYVMVMPATILLSILPIRFLTETFPERAGMVRAVAGLAIIAIALSQMPQVDRLNYDQPFAYAELVEIDRDLAQSVRAPAIVLFHFNWDAVVNGKKITNNPSEEPVFNADVAWPDDAPVIRARDLNADVSQVGKPGDRDRPLYEYYSRVAPARVIYLYDRGGGSARLKRLGTPAELLHQTANRQ